MIQKRKMNKKEGTTLPTNKMVREFAVRVSDNVRKKYHVMNFNTALNINFTQWCNVKMHRENNMQDHQTVKEKMPKFGAGSEYNRELKEKLRREKLGINPHKYKQDDQPWILKLGGKQEKSFRGRRMGGVSAYASYYIFFQNLDGSFDASPLKDWYDFQPVQRYKALSAEAAEKEFGRRNKILNFFSVMTQNRLHDANENEAKAKLGKDFTICDDEDVFMDSDDESDSEVEEKHVDRNTKKAKMEIRCEKRKGNNDSDNDDDDNAFEDSDDGDKESHEMDYGEPSESDESDAEMKIDNELKSVAEEGGLHKLLSSDDESAEEDLK